MLVIVFGHTGGQAIFNPTLPVNFKQVGVVFFVIVTGYLLASERRPWSRVFYNRLFELFLFGILCSVIISVTRLYLIGDSNESNYLPFILGINVFFNGFPANPSLWYIGTYIHLLVVWALILRHIRVRLWMLILTVPAEILIRALLMKNAGDFIAYQALTNWMSILLLGQYLGQQTAGEKRASSKTNLIMYCAILTITVAAWLWITRTLNVTTSNPFGRLPWGDTTTALITTATSVSVIYLFWGIVGFNILRHLPAGPIVRFFSRNSMLIFIIHGPMYAAFGRVLIALPGMESSRYIPLVVNLTVYYAGAGLLSELARRMLNTIGIRNAVERKFLALYKR